MNRLDFYPVVSVDGVSEVDQIGGNLPKFATVRPVSYYRVAQEDLMRPDLISQKAYGTVSFWWAICLVNDLSNPLTDLVEGQLLKVPNLLDLYDFNKAYRIQ
jgi:hypothetical protein